MIKPLISVCIITLGRETIYRTLESIFSQKIDANFEIEIVLQGTLDENRIDILNKRKIPYKIYTYQFWKWFSYYRNQAISNSHGDIIAFIDDDVWFNNTEWLSILTEKVRNNSYKCVTSWCHIELNYDYWSNCISLLWYPWWWALGFQKVWKVSNNITNHICGANFCINKSLLREINFFDERLRASCDDNALSDKVINAWYCIYYEEKSTVEHINRSINSFYNWQLRRIIWFKEYTKIVDNKDNFTDKIANKIFHFRSILLALLCYPKYIFGILLLSLIMICIFIHACFIPTEHT